MGGHTGAAPPQGDMGGHTGAAPPQGGMASHPGSRAGETTPRLTGSPGQ